MSEKSQKREPSPGKGKPPLSSESLAKRMQNMPDPLGPAQLHSMLLRLAIPVVGVWLVCGGVAVTLASSAWVKGILLAIPCVVTVLAGVLVVWSLRQAKKARGVANILGKVETAEDRKAAFTALDASFKKNDPAAIFAKAQLTLEEDPRKALNLLEQIDLNKVMGPIADEARTQRAMIHLMLGEVAPARHLVDGIELNRHQDAKTRALMVAVSSEAWARTGNAKKGADTLGLLRPEEAEYEPLRPQLYRAQAFVFAHVDDQRGMRRALRKLLEIDARLLAGFLNKKTHPLLQKEAKKLLEQSGQIPRKIVMQRRH